MNQTQYVPTSNPGTATKAPAAGSPRQTNGVLHRGAPAAHR